MAGVDQYQSAKAVTPHDTNALSPVAQALYIGTAGALKVTTAEGDDVTFGNVAAGTLLPLKVTHVFATGTAASNITQLY